MTPWHRHATLAAGVRRDRPVVHRHAWVSILASSDDTAYVCETCRTRITYRELRDAQAPDVYGALFAPMCDEPAFYRSGLQSRVGQAVLTDALASAGFPSATLRVSLTPAEGCP